MEGAGVNIPIVRDEAWADLGVLLCDYTPRELAQQVLSLRVALTRIAAPVATADAIGQQSQGWTIMRLRGVIADHRAIAEEALRSAQGERDAPHEL